MKPVFRILTLLAVLAMLLAPTGDVHARGLGEGRIVFGGSFILHSDETLDGDLVVFGGTALVEAGATVQGQAVLIGGAVDIQGTVEGDMVVIGGLLSLGPQAVVLGDLITLGGTVQREPGARVDGRTSSDVPAPELPSVPAMPDLPSVPSVSPDWNLDLNPFGNMFSTLYQAVFVAALAMLASLFLEPHMGRIGAAVSSQPAIAFGLGLAAWLITPIAMLVLIITLIVPPLLAMALALALLFGIIAIGYEIGERFTQMIHQRWAPPLSAGLGTLLLMLVVGGISQVPCVGWLGPVLLWTMAVGGVVMTTFGTRAAAVLRPAAAPAAPPPAGEEIPPTS